MRRYIDADKFAKQAYEVAYPIVHDNNSHERGLTLMGIAQLLDEQPIADVIEVVRCKDCIYKEECGREVLVNEYDNDKAVDITGFLFYCSYGERAEE